MIASGQRIEVDTDSCCGYGNCVELAPDVFELPAGSAVVRLRVANVPVARAGAVHEAVQDCPTQALTLRNS